MKPIIVSPHAFERIHERGVNREDVEWAVRMPDLKGHARHGRLKIAKQIGHRKLYVFLKETDKAYILVTAYWRYE